MRVGDSGRAISRGDFVGNVGVAGVSAGGLGVGVGGHPQSRTRSDAAPPRGPCRVETRRFLLQPGAACGGRGRDVRNGAPGER